MTSEQDPSTAPRAGRWDPLLTELNTLRVTRGEPSYAELTRALIQQRVADGQDLHAARISKSSVHDGFRIGRTRINLGLTRELVRALGADPALVDHWVAAAATPPAVHEDRPAENHADRERPEERPEERGATQEAAAAFPTPISVGHTLVLMVGCLLLNLAGREFVDFFAFPIYLDMVGTAVAAIVLGPWRGAAVGASTNIIGAIGSGALSLPFAAVNITGALVWGFGVRRWRMGRSLPQFFLLNLYAALACSAVAVPILITLVGGQLRAGHDTITTLVVQIFGSTAAAVGFSNVMTSSADKLISGFIALVIISALPLAFRHRVPLVLAHDNTTGCPACPPTAPHLLGPGHDMASSRPASAQGANQGETAG